MGCPTDECRPRGLHSGSPRSKGRRVEKPESPLLRLGRSAVTFLPPMLARKPLSFAVFVATSNSESCRRSAVGWMLRVGRRMLGVRPSDAWVIGLRSVVTVMPYPWDCLPSVGYLPFGRHLFGPESFCQRPWPSGLRSSVSGLQSVCPHIFSTTAKHFGHFSCLRRGDGRRGLTPAKGLTPRPPTDIVCCFRLC